MGMILKDAFYLCAFCYFVANDFTCRNLQAHWWMKPLLEWLHRAVVVQSGLKIGLLVFQRKAIKSNTVFSYRV